MHTLGIDLSTDPRKVWACQIDWSEAPPRVASLVQLSALPDPLADTPPPGTERPPIRTEASLIAGLVEQISRFGPSAERIVGIDAPLGWPSAFVEAVADWDDGDLQGFRKRADLRLRATDRFVHALTGITPMSVSTDRMGSTAMVLAEVLSRTAAKLDRGAFARSSAADGIAEVHPTAALRLWTHLGGERFDTSGYRSTSRYGNPREGLLIGLIACGLEVTPDHGQAMLDSADAMDAFVCALVARAVALRQTVQASGGVDLQDIVPKASAGPRGETIEQTTARLDLAREVLDEAQRTADSEGWIHLPRRSDLAAALGLVPGSASWAPIPSPREAFDPFGRWSNGDGQTNAADPDEYGPVLRFVGEGDFVEEAADSADDFDDELVVVPRWQVRPDVLRREARG
ncbi:MAG: DUF429 domain-containing protein [Solirubrobacteraceae bacterium]|nr:DUF429 domain-containing protein [Patulibacter sp.]